MGRRTDTDVSFARRTSIPPGARSAPMLALPVRAGVPAPGERFPSSPGFVAPKQQRRTRRWQRSLVLGSGTDVSPYSSVKTDLPVVEGVEKAVGLVVGHGVHLRRDPAERLLRFNYPNGQLVLLRDRFPVLPHFIDVAWPNIEDASSACAPSSSVGLPSIQLSSWSPAWAGARSAPFACRLCDVIPAPLHPSAVSEAPPTACRGPVPLSPYVQMLA